MLPVAVCIYTDACTHFVVVALDCDHMMREAVILLAVLLTMLFVHSLNPSTRQTEMGAMSKGLDSRKKWRNVC